MTNEKELKEEELDEIFGGDIAELILFTKKN